MNMMHGLQKTKQSIQNFTKMKTIQEIAQWVIDNRYPKSENNKVSDFEMYRTLIEAMDQVLPQSLVISGVPKVYVISKRKDTINPSSRKVFLNKDLALKYWNEVGKVEYTYWEEYIYDL